MADITHLLEPTYYNHLRHGGGLNLNFFIVGAGGTGGHLIPNLVRQVAVVNEQRKEKLKHKVTILDGDEVESKNLLRQNFVSVDIGKNKAQVMAQRYGRAFSQEVSYVDKYLNDPEEFKEIIIQSLNNNYDYSAQNVIVIDCTDNNKTRLLIKTTLDKLYSFERVFLSSGNEQEAGQVICSFKPRGGAGLSANVIRPGKIGEALRQDVSCRTPDFFEIFANSDIDKLPDELSCAENAISSPQNIATNTTAANILFSYVAKLLANEGISELAIFFDSSTISQKTYRAKLSDYKELLSMTKHNLMQKAYLSHEDIKDSPAEEDDWVKMKTWDEAEEEYKIKKKKELAEAQEQLNAAMFSK